MINWECSEQISPLFLTLILSLSLVLVRTFILLLRAKKHVIILFVKVQFFSLSSPVALSLSLSYRSSGTRLCYRHHSTHHRVIRYVRGIVVLSRNSIITALCLSSSSSALLFHVKRFFFSFFLPSVHDIAGVHRKISLRRMSMPPDIYCLRSLFSFFFCLFVLQSIITTQKKNKDECF